MNPPVVMFACVHNAGRSQMAAGFLREMAGDQVVVLSGGSDPAGAVNPEVAEAMLEVGIDLGTQAPQAWTADMLRTADVIVTMGCGDECPVYPGKRYLDWELDDPSCKSVDRIRPIRDEIKRRVAYLWSELARGAVPG